MSAPPETEAAGPQAGAPVPPAPAPPTPLGEGNGNGHGGGVEVGAEATLAGPELIDDSGTIPGEGTIKSTGLFLDMLDAEDRAAILAFCAPVSFSFGDVIVSEGEPGDALFIIASGRARVVKRRPGGDEIPLAALGPGDCLGEIALLLGRSRTATVRASGDLTTLRLSRGDLDRVLAERPHLRAVFESFVATRARQSRILEVEGLEALPPEIVADFARGLVPVDFPADYMVICEGDPPGPLYLLETGRVRVTRSGGADGMRPVAYLKEGGLFGELSVLRNAPRAATVETLAPTRCLVLSVPAYRAVLDRWPALKRLLEERAEKYEETAARLPLAFARELLPAQAYAPPAIPAPLEREMDGALTIAAAAPHFESARIARPHSPEGRPAPAAPGKAAPSPSPSPSPAPAPAAPAFAPSEEHPFASAEGFFRKLGRARRHFPFVYQVDEMDCGVACLAMICRYHGRRVSLTRIRSLAHTATDGTSLKNLCRAAQELGLAARTARVSRRNVDRMPLPALLHWDDYHWVVLVDVQKTHVRIADPAIGDRWLPRTELETRWNGYAGLFDFTPAFGAAPEGRPSAAWIRPFFGPFKGTLALAVALACVGSALTMLLPIITQVVVDRVVIDGAVSLLGLAIGGMVATFAFLNFGRILQGYLFAFVAVRIDAASLDFLTRRLLALPMTYFHGRRTGDIQRRLDGVRQVREMLATSGVQGLVALVQVIAAVGLMVVYSAKLALVFIGVAPFYAGLMYYSARRLRPLFDKLEETLGRYRSDQMDAIKGIEAVKSAGAEGSFRDQLLDRFLGMATQQFRADFSVLTYQSAVQAVGFLTSVVFLWLGARLAMAGELTLGGLVAFTSLVAMANAPLGTFLALWDRLQFGGVLLDRLADVFETEPEQGRDRDRLLPVRTLSGEVELRKVSFRYGGADSPWILRDVTLKVPAGKTIALVGRSGSGKTTLVKLLAGLIEPSEGTILFDGVDQRTLNYRDLRRHLGYVLQENHMFCATILANIAFGDEPELDKAIAAAKAANAHEFIERLPLGYETKIGESGLALSGGQKQRVAIARAVYGRPAILILDEATSALDAESERAIQENMKTLLVGRTAFVIAHRLSTVREADRICVLEKGEVVEEGSHEELIARRGIYHYLVSRQVEG